MCIVFLGFVVLEMFVHGLPNFGHDHALEA